MKKEKAKTSFSTTHVADELERIAVDLRAGKFAFTGVELSVGGRVDFKKKQRLEGGLIKYEIAMRIPLVSTESEDVGAGKMQKQRTNQDKQLKKKIAAQWKILSRDIKNNSIPDGQLLVEFKENCESYGQWAPPLWRPLWQKCANTMMQAVELALSGSFDQAMEFVDLAHQYKKNGHKNYK